MTIQEAMNLALQRHQDGRIGEAETIYRQVLAQQPNHPDALNLLGVIAGQMGRHEAALDLIGKAIALKPNDAGYHTNMGVALAEQSRFSEAITAYRQALALDPHSLPLLCNLAETLNKAGEAEEALVCYRQAIRIQPNSADLHNALAGTLHSLGRFDEAIVAYRQAVDADPKCVHARSNLCNALNNQAIISYDQGALDRTVDCYQQALALCPDLPEAHYRLGVALEAQGKLDQTIKCYQTALARRADYPEAHTNLGAVLLLQGHLEQGWPHYEWRWRVKFDQPLGLKLPKPRWDGSNLDGKRICLHCEQGFGDAIQFIRYVPLVAQRGGRIIVACRPELLALFSTVAGVEKCVTDGQPAPEFETHCPLLSLPGLLGTTLANIPAPLAYLAADATKAQHWHQRLAEETRLKVGLVWAGRPDHTDDRNRSMVLTQLAGLREVPGIRYISLQKGAAAGQTGSSSLEITDWSDELKDFADTAALVANLDLVISVDTAVAHLAGAMGKRTWVLLPFMPDWRWLLNRNDSPWYPTMRLFRQPTRGDWETPIGEVARALKEES